MSRTKRAGEIKAIKQSLTDARGRKLVLIAHCLLNQNARYQGGASCPGCILPCTGLELPSDWGILQLPCPEIPAWGGPDKPWLWWPVRRSRFVSAMLGFAGLPLFILWTRVVFHFQARHVASEIRAWQRRGYLLEAVIGIDGSPSCGINQTLDLASCFRLYRDMPVQGSELQDFNRNLYAMCLKDGQGLFMGSLWRQLYRALPKGQQLPEFRGWSLPAELGCS